MGMIKCIDCGENISKPHYKRTRCFHCYKKYRKKYLKKYHKVHNFKAQKKYWKKNKDRYKYRNIIRLGNPAQDKKILKFIRNKRKKNKTKKYRALPNDAFFKQNEAEFYCE